MKFLDRLFKLFDKDKQGNELIGASIDVETTGLEAGISEIIHLTVILHDEELNETSRFVSKIRPMHPEWAEDEALKVNQMSLLELRSAPTPAEVRSLFYQWHENIAGGKKIFPLGQNYPFDKSFLQVFFGDNYKELFHYKHRDTGVVAQFLKDSGLVPLEVNMSLVGLCEYFGIPHVPHDATGDAKATLKLYKIMLGMIGGKDETNGNS